MDKLGLLKYVDKYSNKITHGVFIKNCSSIRKFTKQKNESSLEGSFLLTA